jgi:hypothetical protein
MVAEDLSLLVSLGTTQIANLFLRSSGTRPIQGQSNEAAIVEGLVALGLTHCREGCLAGDTGVKSFGEITEGVVSEAAAVFRLRAPLRPPEAHV